MAKSVASLCNLGSDGASIDDIETSVELSDSCEVFEKTPVPDMFGGNPITLTPLGTIDCRLLGVAKFDERVEGDVTQGVTIWKCFFAKDGEIIPNSSHRLAIKEHAYEVIETNEDLSDATVLIGSLVRIGRRP